MFLVINGILNIFLKTVKKKINKHGKHGLLARSKRYSIENITSKMLTDPDISHEEFTLVISKAKNYCRLEENKNTVQKVTLKEIDWWEYQKKIGID